MRAVDVLVGDELPGLGRVFAVEIRPGWTRILAGGKTFDAPSELLIYVDRVAPIKEVPTSKQYIPTPNRKTKGQGPIPSGNPFAVEPSTVLAANADAFGGSSGSGAKAEEFPATSGPVQ